MESQGIPRGQRPAASGRRSRHERRRFYPDYSRPVNGPVQSPAPAVSTQSSPPAYQWPEGYWTINEDIGDEGGAQ